MLRELPSVTSTTNRHEIPTHRQAGTGLGSDQQQQGDICLKLQGNSHLAND